MKLFSFCAYQAFSIPAWLEQQKADVAVWWVDTALRRRSKPCVCVISNERAALTAGMMFSQARISEKNLHLEQMDASERQHWQVRNEEAKYCSFIWNFIFTLNEDSDTQLSKCHVAFRHHNACGENVTLTVNIFYEWQYNKTASIWWWCINRNFGKTAKAQSICLLHSSLVSDGRGWC